MVARSLALWDELARETVRRLYIETGVLTLGQPDDGHTLPGLDVMRARGAVERLTAGESRALPAVPAGDFGAITWNPRGGMLPRLNAVWRSPSGLARTAGHIREGAQVTRVEPDGRAVGSRCGRREAHR